MAVKKSKQTASSVSLKTTPVKEKTVEKKWMSEAGLQNIIILIISILIYANTLFFNFAIDDGLIITDNKVTQKGYAGLPEIFTKNSFYGVFGDKANEFLPGGRYRPLSQALFAIEYQFFGLNPFIGHLLNVLIYSLLCLLLLKILRIILAKYESKKWYLSVPFVATLLFTCHPLHTEVVANIKSCDELLAIMGSLAALYFSIRYFKKEKYIDLLLIFIVFTLALLSKESAITFIAVIPLSLYFVFQKPLKHYIFVVLPMIVSVLVYFALRYNALGFLNNNVTSDELLNNPYLCASPVEKFATIFFTWGKYLLLMVFPHPLTHDYYPFQIAIINFSNPWAILSLLFYMAIALFGIIYIWKKNIIAYAVLFFMITFSISSNLVFNIGTFMNERFIFAPLLGFTIIIAYFISKYLNKKNHILIAQSIIVLMISLYSIKTFSRNFAWKDSYILLTTDVITSSNSAKANVGAGEVLIKSINDSTPEPLRTKTIEKALTYFQKGVKIYPGFTSGWIYLGFATHLLKDYYNSRLALIEVLKKDNTNADALTYLKADAISCYKNGNIKQAEDNLKTLIKYVPEHTEYENLLAEVYANTTKADSAMILLNNILAKDPNNARACNKIGEICGRIYHNFPKSFDYLLKSYELNSRDIENLRNLGTAYGLQGDYRKSLKYLLEAEKVKPDDKDILYKLAITYKNLGDLKMFNEYARKVQ